MNNNVRIGAASGPTLLAGWTVAGLADFNFDGYPDYLLYHASTRGTVVWYMRNNAHIGSAPGPILPAGSSLAGVADFNADGHPDYLLFNPSTRGTTIWYMSGVTHTATRSAPTVTMPYDLVGLADFDGNGRPDYVLYNPGTRRTALWYLNNNQLIDTANGPTLPTGWEFGRTLSGYALLGEQPFTSLARSKCGPRLCAVVVNRKRPSSVLAAPSMRGRPGTFTRGARLWSICRAT